MCKKRLHCSPFFCLCAWRTEQSNSSSPSFPLPFFFCPGRFCGSVPPGRVLMSNSQNATLLFSSDINQAGRGFVVRHRALRGHADPGGTPELAPPAHTVPRVCRVLEPDPCRGSCFHARDFSYVAVMKINITSCIQQCNIHVSSVLFAYPLDFHSSWTVYPTLTCARTCAHVTCDCCYSNLEGTKPDCFLTFSPVFDHRCLFLDSAREWARAHF